MKHTALMMVMLVAGMARMSAQSLLKDERGKAGELYDVIARADDVVFGAFNAHDLQGLMTMFTEDLEFYHDTGGRSDHRGTTEGFARMFDATPDIRRELVSGSLEVYPVKDFGAIETGEHRFVHRENGKEESGTFRFAMVWRKTDDTWQIARVLSYGH